MANNSDNEDKSVEEEEETCDKNIKIERVDDDDPGQSRFERNLSVVSISNDISFEEKALGHDLTIKTLLSFLSLQDLKMVRQLSKFFNHQTTRFLYARHFLSLSKPTLRASGGLEPFLLNYVKLVRFKHIKVKTIGLPPYDKMDLLPHLDLYGVHVKSLIIVGHLSKHKLSKFFHEDAHQLTNLRVLSIYQLPMMGDPEDDVDWSHLLKLLGQLDELRVERICTDTFLYLSSLGVQGTPKCVQKLWPGLNNWSTLKKFNEAIDDDDGYGGDDDDDQFPVQGSLVGGQDLIVARAHLPQTLNKVGRYLVPGQVLSSKEGCCVAWDETEYTLEVYQTLLLNPNQVEWVASNATEKIPLRAIVGGVSGDDDILYIGRVCQEGSSRLGNIPRHRRRVLSSNKNGNVDEYYQYEILLLKDVTMDCVN